MKQNITIATTMPETARESITDVFKREGGRLLGFIKQRVSAPEEAEDILQDVFTQLVDVQQYAEPIEQVSAWLFKVARNKIIDKYRKKKTLPFSQVEAAAGSQDEDGEGMSLADILPDISSSPDLEYTRAMIWEEIERALTEIPQQQREVFVMHELEGMSFRQISEVTETPINTLLSRKRYAILALRERLQDLYIEIINT